MPGFYPASHRIILNTHAQPRALYIYSEEKVQSIFMFSHKINNTGYIIVKVCA